jgi:hypothetical protein
MASDTYMADASWSEPPSSDPFAPEKWGSDFDTTAANDTGGPATENQTTEETEGPQTTESPMTFGVEIEFIGFYKRLHSFQRLDDPDIMANSRGYVVVNHDDDDLSALRIMIQTLRLLGLDINNYNAEAAAPEAPAGAPKVTPYSSNSCNPVYHRWTLRWESSLQLVIGEDGHMEGPMADTLVNSTVAMPLELISPAMKMNAANSRRSSE